MAKRNKIKNKKLLNMIAAGLWIFAFILMITIGAIRHNNLLKMEKMFNERGDMFCYDFAYGPDKDGICYVQEDGYIYPYYHIAECSWGAKYKVGTFDKLEDFKWYNQIKLDMITGCYVTYYNVKGEIEWG